MTKLINKLLKTGAVLIGIALIATACSGRPKGVLSQSDMVSFLTDLHKLDGSLEAKGMGNMQDRENLYYYNALLKKHGITKAQFDSSLVYYTSKPKRFERIYSSVVDNLTAFEKEVKSLKYHPIDSAALRKSTIDLWPLKQNYALTKDSARTQLAFCVKHSELSWNDTYELSFLQKVSPKDSSENKYIVIRVHYKNNITDSIYTPAYADDLMRRYTIRLKARRLEQVDSVTGKLLGSKRYKGTLHAAVDSIKLIRHYDAIAQDSIRKLLMPAPIELTKPLNGNLPEKTRLRSKVLLYKHETRKQPTDLQFSR
jgi:hypothetical protein